jgi:hypothetical protein
MLDACPAGLLRKHWTPETWHEHTATSAQKATGKHCHWDSHSRTHLTTLLVIGWQKP